MSTRAREIDRLAAMYCKYLNGPLGKGVMQHLKDGESFTIKIKDESVEISNQQGKAVVRIINAEKRPTDSWNQTNE